MADRIVLVYSRRHELVDDEHPYDGYIEAVDGESRTRTDEFAGVPFKRLINRLSTQARQHPRARVFMSRLEHPYESELEPTHAQMLRKDPVAFTRMLDAPPARLSLRSDVRVEDRLVVRPALIRAGHDTLAEGFGDEIYCRRRDDKIESPFDGRWVDAQQFTIVTDIVTEQRGKWWAIKTSELLAAGPRLSGPVVRYFLPREWNTSGPWVRHTDLKNMYENYLKEKEICSDRKQHDPSA